jgi:hypothetical protein
MLRVGHERREKAAAREAVARRELQRLAVQGAQQQRECVAQRLREDCARLGSVSIVRAGPLGAL